MIDLWGLMKKKRKETKWWLPVAAGCCRLVLLLLLLLLLSLSLFRFSAVSTLLPPPFSDSLLFTSFEFSSIDSSLAAASSRCRPLGSARLRPGSGPAPARLPPGSRNTTFCFYSASLKRAAFFFLLFAAAIFFFLFFFVVFSL